MHAVILGDGPMGRALAAALETRGDSVCLLGRPAPSGHPPGALSGAEVILEASVGAGVRPNVEAALAAGCRRLVIATTGWDRDRSAVAAAASEAGAAAVCAANFSLGTVLFVRLVERAARLYGERFDPFIVEWHRRAKRDTPSGTAARLAEQFGARRPEIASVRAGSAPGMHLVSFDAPGETVELRITARDRNAFAAGAVAAADWLLAEPRRPGLHFFDEVVDDLITTPQHERTLA